MSERYSTTPDPIPNGIVPTLKELEDTRQAALLMLKPTDEDSKAALVNLAAVLGFTVQGCTEREIVKATGLTRRQVRIARRALEARALLGSEVERAVSRLTNDALPLAVDNVMDALEAGSEKYTDRVLDTMGFGVAKGTRAGEGNGATAQPLVPSLTLNFNLPPGVTVERANIMPASGRVIGRGKDAPMELLPADESADHGTIDLPVPRAADGT